MNITIADLDEPPFYWTSPDGTPTGAGIELAEVVLRSIDHQPEAVEALLARRIDAFTATALGARALAAAHPALEAVSHAAGAGVGTPVGAFSFRKDHGWLREAVDGALRTYLGSDDHRARMAKYGFGAAEIEGVLRGLPT